MTGPGGTISLGAGAGNAQEGISVEFIDDKDNMLMGADGSGVHSLRASNAARITGAAAQNQPGQCGAYAINRFQRQSTLFWGQNC